MPRNEDGEFELVVGNKQLLSIVFILMVLFGVVFSMGYFVGRANTANDAPAPALQAANQTSRPAAAGAESPASATPAADTTPDTPLQPGDAKVTSPETAAATTPVSTAPVAVETSAATPPPRPTATPKPAATPAPAPKAPAAGPQAGQTYLQVAAVKKPQAEMLVEVLKEKGFRAMSAPLSPTSELHRALVGPLQNASEIAKIKADLENAGFKPIIKRF